MTTNNAVNVSLAGQSGTGAFAGSTSPSFTTPDLGTPSAGVLTNCTGLLVAGGGTGASSLTAYAVLCGGTTSTAAVQSVASVGTAGQILTSNGAGALPTFQTSSSSGIVTDWVAYTPTFAGLGTVTSIGWWSRRVGDSLEVRGKATTGTISTSTTFSVTLGYNGTDSNITSSASKITGNQTCGLLAKATNPVTNSVIVTASSGVLNAGNAGTNQYAIGNVGACGFSSSSSFSLFASVPVDSFP